MRRNALSTIQEDILFVNTFFTFFQKFYVYRYCSLLLFTRTDFVDTDMLAYIEQQEPVIMQTTITSLSC